MILWILSLSAVAVALRTKDPITSGKLFPPSSTVTAYSTATSDTGDASGSVASVGFITAPNGDSSGASVYDVSDLSLHNIKVGSTISTTGNTVGSISITGTSSASMSPTFYDVATSSDASSVTAEAVVANMDLSQCVEQVRFTNSKYTSFNDAITALSEQVRQSEMKLSGIDVVTHNILTEESSFSSELDRLNVLYNTLAVRMNALGKWMSDEKTIRMQVEELYREMVSKNGEENNRLSLLRKDLTLALTRLSDVQTKTSGILSSVANAQIAMYDWAVNVTDAVNNQTTKITSLTKAIQYRIQQVDTIMPEMRNMAKKTQFIAQSLGETNFAFAAANVLNHVQSVMNSVNISDSIMSIPYSQGS